MLLKKVDLLLFKGILKTFISGKMEVLNLEWQLNALIKQVATLRSENRGFKNTIKTQESLIEHMKISHDSIIKEYNTKIISLTDEIETLKLNQETKSEEIKIELIDDAKLVEEQNIIENCEEDFSCKICFGDMEIHNIVWMDMCDHKFCKDCMQELIKFSIDNSKLDIKCPSDECMEQLDFQLIKEILGEDEIGRNYISKYDNFLLNRTLENFSDIVYCPISSCSKPCIQTNDNKKIKCEQCDHIFCFDCKQEWHDGYSCEEYEEWKKETSEYDDSFKQYIKENKVKKCNKCKRLITKKSGCSHMTCTCGNQFCYMCGKDYKGSEQQCECNVEDDYIYSDGEESVPERDSDDEGVSNRYDIDESDEE